MKLFSRQSCAAPSTPGQPGRDDPQLLGSSLFTIFLMLAVVLFG